MQDASLTEQLRNNASLKNCNGLTKVKLLLVLEFCLLCVLLPTIIITFRLAPAMFLFLWAATFFCWYTMHKSDSGFWRGVWNEKAINRQNLKWIIPRWALASAGMLLFLYCYDPNRLFTLINNRPQIVPFLLFAYPFLSALPQEMIFCAYFFDRFKALFQSPKARIIASAIVFAYAHVLYINWVAPLLSLIAGLIFASTYAKTRSLALVTLEHALYGNAMFMIGLGWYFWGGAVH